MSLSLLQKEGFFREAPLSPAAGYGVLCPQTGAVFSFLVSLFVLSHRADNRLTSFTICSAPDRSVLVQTPWSFQAGVFLLSAHHCPFFIGINLGSFLIQILSMNTAGVNHAPEISQPEQSEAKEKVRRKRFSFPYFSNLSGEAQVRQMKQHA